MNVSAAMTVRMVTQGLRNSWRKKPLSVSFEVTHACTANCWHCNWGGPIKETRLAPEAYGAICRELDPVISHLSGGEPLARGDLDEIVRAMSNPGRLPFLVVVSNASLLTPERFLRLKRAGMHQLSLSIDFPDPRHDAFRRIPGLFDRMERVVPECARIGEAGDVVLKALRSAPLLDAALAQEAQRLKAAGAQIGSSLLEAEKLPLASELLREAESLITNATAAVAQAGTSVPEEAPRRARQAPRTDAATKNAKSASAGRPSSAATSSATLCAT